MKRNLKLPQAIFYAISTMILAVLAIFKWMFQDEASNLMHVGLIIVFGGMATSNFTAHLRYIKSTK